MRFLLLAAVTVGLTVQDKTLGPTPDEVLKDFKQAYVKAGQNVSARVEAVRDLARAPHAKTMAALGQVLVGNGSQQEVSEVRIAAAETIGKSFAAIPNSWKPLATVARNRDRKAGEVRIASVHAMSEIAAPSSLRTLQEFVDDKPFEMAKEAVDALAKIPDRSSVPLL